MVCDGSKDSDPEHWFEALADHMGSAYLRYSFTKGTNQEIDALLQMVDVGAGARVLDVGCGPGRHSLELARRGFDVTGVDISSTFVELATAAANAEGLDRCRFVRLDGRDLGRRFPGRFDLVLSLCQGAFGLTGGPGSDRHRSAPEDLRLELDEPMLAAMAEAVAPSGRVVVSAFSAYFQLRYGAPTATDDGTKGGGGSVTSDQIDADGGGSGVDDFDAEDGVNHERTSILDDDGRPRSAELWTTCYTPRELRLLARTVGLVPLAVYGVTPGGYGRFPPSTDCPEFLLVAGRRS